MTARLQVWVRLAFLACFPVCFALCACSLPGQAHRAAPAVVTGAVLPSPPLPPSESSQRPFRAASWVGMGLVALGIAGQFVAPLRPWAWRLVATGAGLAAAGYAVPLYAPYALAALGGAVVVVAVFQAGRRLGYKEGEDGPRTAPREAA